MIERAVVVAEGPTVTEMDLPPELLRDVHDTDWLPEVNDDTGALGTPIPGLRPEAEERAGRSLRERERLVRALARAGGNKAEAARALGIARSTLVSRLKKYGLS